MYNIYVLLVIGDLAENLASYLDETDTFSNFANTNLCVLIFDILIDESFVWIFHRKNLTSLSNNIILSSLSTSDTHTKHDISTLNWKYCQKQRKIVFNIVFVKFEIPFPVDSSSICFPPHPDFRSRGSHNKPFSTFFFKTNFAWLFHAS